MALTKREFLLAAAAAGTGAMFGRHSARAQDNGQARARVIDSHTHWYPPEWVELVQKEGPAAGARLGTNERGGVTFFASGMRAVFGPNTMEL
jgi:hypothetical protein